MFAKRGSAHERDLVKKLWSHGLAAIRAPASGSKAKRFVYPDVVAIYKGKVIIAEVKSVKKPRSIYVSKSKIEKLKEFATRAGGNAYIAVKIIGTGEWIFIPVESLVDTGKSFKITSVMLSHGVKLETLISTIKGVKKLTEFTEEHYNRKAT